MATEEPTQGVSNCYVFKSQLQEYAQKVGLSTPIYETVKEGPSHQPTFRSTVIVNDIRYDSLPDFFNRKAAEQSAAEVALVKMAQSGQMEESVSQPLHETGLCKNLLQEYAQKMNYAMPIYKFEKDETKGRGVLYTCTAEIGGINYIGGASRTKKEAEIKAARTALFAIQSSPSELAKKVPVNSEYTVLPYKKPTITVEPTKDSLKPKKRRCKKKRGWNKKKREVNEAVDPHHEEILNKSRDDDEISNFVDSISAYVNRNDSGFPSIEESLPVDENVFYEN